MYVKRLKRKCSVRGCKNTDTFAISLTREVGNTVIACKSCLEKALGAIDDLKTEPVAPPVINEPPALFFSDILQGVQEQPGTQEPEPEQFDDAPPAESDDTPPEQEPEPEQTDDVPPTQEPEQTEVSEGDGTSGTPAEPSKAEQTDFVCPHCGQVCKSELGLQSHIRAKHKDLA